MNLSSPDDDKPAASANWARLIKKVYEVDPLVCDKCGGPMKIIAFIQRESEIKRICRSLGIEDYRAPPKVCPSSNNHFADISPDC